MQRRRRVVWLVMMTLGLLSAGPFMLVGEAQGAQSKDVLTIYSGRGEKFTRPVTKAFTQHTGIPVRLQTGSSAALLAKLRLEGNRSPADIFITNYVGVLEVARQRNLLVPVTSVMVQQISPEFRAVDNSWLAFSARLRVIVYNTDMVQPHAITSLLDLADPIWQGKVGTVTSGNQSFIGGITALYALRGAQVTEAFLRGLKVNSQGRVMPKHSRVVSAVAAGEFPVGYVNHYYYYRHKAQHPNAPLGIIIPDQGAKGMGAVVTVTGAAILKASKNRAAAERFMEFLLAPVGQKIFAAVNYEYPVNPQVPSHAAVVRRQDITLAPVNLSLAYSNRQEAIALIEKVGLE